MATDAGFTDDKFSVGKGVLRLHEVKGISHGSYWCGEFLDPRGIVTIYRQMSFPLTRLDFMLNGKVYCRSWERFLGDRAVRRAARDFITDVCEKFGVGA